VASLHALLGERTGVREPLLANSAPAWLFGRIILIGRPRMHHAARAEHVAEVRKVLWVWVVRQFWLFLGVEVIEIAEELVEAMAGRQHVVQVTEMFLAELAGRVALVLEAGSDSDQLIRHADRRSRHADLREAGAIDALSGNKGGAACGTGLFAIGIGEHHAF